MLAFLWAPAVAQDAQPKSQLRTSDPLVQRIANLEELVYKLNKTLELSLGSENVNPQIPGFKPSFELALGAGFHLFNSSPPQYIINSDSQLLVYGGMGGITSMINGVIAYRITPLSGVFMNIPLIELSAKRQNSFGLFSGSFMIGFGYIRHLDAISFYGSVNIQPYQLIIEDYILNNKIEQAPYTPLDISTLPTYTAYSHSLSLGVAFKLWGSQNQSI